MSTVSLKKVLVKNTTVLATSICRFEASEYS